MFDGIDQLVLPAADIEPLRSLYVDALGFTVVASRPVLDVGVQELLHLPAQPTRELVLGKPGSAGGWIRLVEVPGLPAATPAGRPDRIGPYALDFYLRDAEATERQIEQAAWSFGSEAVHYLLPGTQIPVRERMLENPVSGLLHATVQWRPRGTRCVIDRGIEDTSEVVAAVFFTDRIADASRFAVEVLGAEQYFTGRFEGPEVEQMLGLDPGEGFAARLFRGPRSRNARLEFAEVMPGGNRAQDPVHRVVATCAVADLDTLIERLGDGTHGRLTRKILLGDVPHVGFASHYGAAFDFFQRAE